MNTPVDVVPEVPEPARSAAEAVRAAQAAQTRLAELAGQPVARHVTVYDEVHSVLQGALAGLD